MGKERSESVVLTQLSRKNDIRVDQTNTIKILSDKVINKDGEVVDNPKKRFDLGNKSWGKIDFLVNHCGYSRVNVDSF